MNGLTAIDPRHKSVPRTNLPRTSIRYDLVPLSTQRLCSTCGERLVTKPKRVCPVCRKAKPATTVTVKRPSMKGSNARGIAAHKPAVSRVKVKPHRTARPPKPVTAYRSPNA